MKKFTFAFFVILTTQMYAQISFEKGYFIDNSNIKKDCFIKNLGWSTNPEEIEYKLHETGDIQKGNLSNLKEFGIYDDSKYVKSLIELDISSNNLNQISNDKNPTFVIETVFLKVLIEGEINLYQYNKNSLLKFYFSKMGSNPEPLIYKKYRVSELLIKENLMFKNQIWNLVKDSDIKINEINSLLYNHKDLSKIFLKYNIQNNSLTIDNTNKNKSILNLYLKSGLIFSSFETRSKTRNENYRYDSTTQPYFGFEAEFILGSSKNKWAIIVDPSYSRFKGEFRDASNKVISSIDYASIDIPLGVRYNMYISNKSRLFINTFYLLDFPLKIDAYNKFNFNSETYNLKWQGSTTDFEPILGLGYNFDNKFSFEMRYCFNNNVLNRMRIYETKYSNLSLTVGYRILNYTKRK